MRYEVDVDDELAQELERIRERRALIEETKADLQASRDELKPLQEYVAKKEVELQNVEQDIAQGESQLAAMKKEYRRSLVQARKDALAMLKQTGKELDGFQKDLDALDEEK